MLETVKYLIGATGPSGYGSKSTAEKVTESCPDLRSITAIITGNDTTRSNAIMGVKQLDFLCVLMITRRFVGDRGGDGSGVGYARGAAGPPGAEHQGG